MFHHHHCNHSHPDEKKHIFGSVKVGDRGQIVIPKEARELFDIKPGDTLIVLGDEDRGIAIVKADAFKKIALSILQMFEKPSEEPPEEPREE